MKINIIQNRSQNFQGTLTYERLGKPKTITRIVPLELEKPLYDAMAGTGIYKTHLHKSDFSDLEHILSKVKITLPKIFSASVSGKNKRIYDNKGIIVLKTNSVSDNNGANNFILTFQYDNIPQVKRKI